MTNLAFKNFNIDIVVKMARFQIIPGSPPKLRQFGFKEISVHTETTWSHNMSYERKFCGLSEYVRLIKVRPLIKSTD